MPFVEAAGGKSPRKDDGVVRDAGTQLCKSAANDPMMDWSERSGFSIG